MNKKTTVILLLDRSGSMGTIRNEAIAWYNEQAQQIQEDAQNQEIDVCLISFNGNVWEHLWKRPAKELELASAKSYVPNGGTAFRDAVGYAIDKAMSEDDGEQSYLLVVISDGDDTSSKQYNETLIREIFDGTKNTGRWTYNFLGCKESDLNRIAETTGVSTSNMGLFSYDNVAGAAQATRQQTKKYFLARSMGSSSVDNFNESSGIADYSNVTPVLDPESFCPMNRCVSDNVFQTSNCTVPRDGYIRPEWKV